MQETNQSEDKSVFGVRDYVDMSQRISRLEKFEEQIICRLTLKEDEADEKLEAIDIKIDRLHKIKTDLIKSEIVTVKIDLRNDVKFLTDNIERRQDLIRAEIGEAKTELRKDVRVVSDSIESKHRNISLEIKEVHESIMRFVTMAKTMGAVGGVIVSLFTVGSWIIDHKTLFASFFK